MSVHSYEIGEKTYEQKPLVLGQLRQLLDVVAGTLIPHGADAMALVAALGDKLPRALAIILTPEGVNLRNKDIDALAANLEFDISLEQSMQVVEDFFTCNPIASLLEKLTGAMGKATQGATGLKTLSASSPEEALSTEEKSSGDAHSESAPLT